MKNALLVFLLLSAPYTHAQETPGPHGGQVVTSEARQFEIKIDRDTKNIAVYTLNKQTPAPKSMAITLFREAGDGQTVALKAVSLKDPLPKYQGELSLTSGSYVGAELRFEISMKSFKVLKFIPNQGLLFAPAQPF